jgi:hypothetical protein
VVGRHAAGVALRSNGISRGRLLGRGKEEAKQITIAETFIYKLLGAPGSAKSFGDGVRDLERLRDVDGLVAAVG